MKIVGYTRIDIADNHEPKCDIKSSSKQKDSRNIQHNNHQPVTNRFSK